MQKKANAIVFPSYFIQFYLHVNKHYIFLIGIQGKMRWWGVGIDIFIPEEWGNEFCYV